MALMKENEWVLKLGWRTNPDMSIDAKGNIVPEESGIFVASTGKEALAEAKRRCRAMRCYLITQRKIMAFDTIPRKYFWRTLWKWFKHPVASIRYLAKRDK
jgi:hypothetical protein